MAETSWSVPKQLAHSSFSSSVHSLLPKDNLFKNIFVGTPQFFRIV